MQISDLHLNAFTLQRHGHTKFKLTNTHTNNWRHPPMSISGATHPENIKGIVPWGPETTALHRHERGFPKQNPFLIALLWALWGFTWNESNLLPWCSYFVLDSMSWGVLTNQQAAAPPCGLRVCLQLTALQENERSIYMTAPSFS